MAQATKIEWTEQSWNFLRGCRRVSQGCGSDRGGGCYAERQAIRHAGPGGPYEGLVKSTPKGPRWTGEISFHEDILLAPLKRKKPTTYFVNSMSDLFYEKVTDEMLDKAFRVMFKAKQHTFQILTKRAERMLEYVAARWVYGKAQVWEPASNIWLGVSVEDQKTADDRIPLLLKTPAAVRWISAEPLLGPIDFRIGKRYKMCSCLGVCRGRARLGEGYQCGLDTNNLDWVVVGGESGPGARQCNIEDIRSIVAQCKAAHVPVFVKQLGARPFYQKSGTAADMMFPNGVPDGVVCEGGWVSSGDLALKSRKGGDIDEWPEDLRVREFPEVKNAK